MGQLTIPIKRFCFVQKRDTGMKQTPLDLGASDPQSSSSRKDSSESQEESSDLKPSFIRPKHTTAIAC
jgi:hypothetical protein